MWPDVDEGPCQTGQVVCAAVWRLSQANTSTHPPLLSHPPRHQLTAKAPDNLPALPPPSSPAPGPCSYTHTHTHTHCVSILWTSHRIWSQLYLLYPNLTEPFDIFMMDHWELSQYWYCYIPQKSIYFWTIPTHNYSFGVRCIMHTSRATHMVALDQ